jgi:HD-like signal output (HDOD) protein
MVLNKYFPKMFFKVLSEAEKEKYFLEAEKKILGFTHEDIGIWLADKWNLPEDILATVGHHHTPMLAQSCQKHAALIHVADYVITVNVLNITDHDPEYSLDRAALDMLGISESCFDTLRTSATKEMLSDEMFN